jgi:hypothetical protein
VHLRHADKSHRRSTGQRDSHGLARGNSDLDGRQRRSAEGDGRLLGFTAPPGTPGFKFIESLTFLDGGTGRFEHAEGIGTGIVDPVAQTAVYDGWIRYGKK